jgi:acetyl esterase/lipase
VTCVSDPRDVLDRPAPPPTTSVRYGEGREQVVDLWRPVVDPAAPTAGPPDPPDRPAPVIGLIHGGFWRAEYDRHHVRPLANALAAAGYAVAAIEYRRTRRRSPGWPGTVEDVRAALTRLPDLVEAAFDRPAGPVLLVGHSAGGHLALRAALGGLTGRTAG